MNTKDVRLLRDGVKQLIEAGDQHNLRDKQVEALSALVSSDFTDEQISHSYFKLPTGFGKTVLFATMARAYFNAIKSAGGKRQKIIIIVPRLSLINQTREMLDAFAEINATEYSCRAKDNQNDIIITTYNSLNKLFGTVDFNSVGLIFADEAHHMLGEKISKKLAFYNNYVPVIGFTATPEYEENHAVANMLNTEIFAMNIPDSIESGILSPVKNVLYRSSIVCDLSEIPAKTNGEFDYEKITKKINPNVLVTEIARIYAEGFDEDTGIEFKTLKAIINCPNTEIANLQAAKINEIMGREVAVSLHKVGINDKQYSKMQQDFVNGKYSVACQVGTMTEGFDDIKVAMCINYPTRSRVKAEQTAGRAIRVDVDNPDKIAFVVDTIFRGAPNELLEDILYTASNAHQVLFKDIAGEMILFPYGFQQRLSRHGKTGAVRRENSKTKITDFELITDNTTLVELNNSAKERIQKEFVARKTDEWLSANDLVFDKTFPSSDFVIILNKLQELQNKMPEFIQLRQTASNHIARCLHKDGREKFIEMAGFKYYPPKTEEWLSAKDLAFDKTFPVNRYDNILEKMKELQAIMPEFIQIRKPEIGVPGLCLHRDARQMFFEKSGFTDYPKKTKEWQSAKDLRFDETFPINNDQVILKKLETFQSEMPEFIQIRKALTRTPLCLHRDGRELFLEKCGVKYWLPKTEEWLSANDLASDKAFPMSNKKIILKKLEALQSEMPEFIQIRKALTRTPLCLHRDAREMFLEKCVVKHYPPKTAEWLSANDLILDKTFPMGYKKNILRRLEEIQSEMPEFIQMRKPQKGPAGLCLRRDAREMFLEICSVKEYKTKTEEWQSAVDLKQDETFPISNDKFISKKLKELQSVMPEFIQMRKPRTGASSLCLYRKGREEFLRHIQESKIKPIKQAKRVTSAKTELAKITETIGITTKSDAYSK